MPPWDLSSTGHASVTPVNLFTIINFGAAPNPWPTVVTDPLPVYLTILIPAVWFTETVDAKVPSELAEPAPPAFQFQPT